MEGAEERGGCILKITDVKSAIIGENIVIRVATDKGVDGYSQVEARKDYVREIIPFFREKIVGCNPVNVEDVLRRVRRYGGFKPWGKIFSSIEIALWDIAGKEAGLPVYRLMGGKVRDRVRVYQGGFADPNPPYPSPKNPEEAGENILHLNELPEGFSIVKGGGFWHGGWGEYIEKGSYNSYYYPDAAPGSFLYNGSLLKEETLKKDIDNISRLKKVVGDRVGLAFDVGPGFMPTDAIRLAKAIEPFNVVWLEDSIAGDYTPYTMWKTFSDVTTATTTPIHTGEQIYLRQNFMDLIENRAVDVIGPDPADTGGIAELKWIAEYAQLHGILIAPHGKIDGVFGIAALTQVCSTMPQNYIAYEFPHINPAWWADIVDGLPDPLLRDGHIKVSDAPGLGLTFNVSKAEKYLNAEDKDFFL